MSWRFEHQRFENILRLTADGPMTSSDVLAQVTEGVSLIRQYAIPSALVDYSGAVLEMPAEEVILIPDLLDHLVLPKSTRIGIALPSDPANMHKFTLLDDAANARGYQVKLFWEPSRAMDWVMAQ